MVLRHAANATSHFKLIYAPRLLKGLAHERTVLTISGKAHAEGSEIDNNTHAGGLIFRLSIRYQPNKNLRAPCPQPILLLAVSFAPPLNPSVLDPLADGTLRTHPFNCGQSLQTTRITNVKMTSSFNWSMIKQRRNSPWATCCST